MDILNMLKNFTGWCIVLSMEDVTSYGHPSECNVGESVFAVIKSCNCITFTPYKKCYSIRQVLSLYNKTSFLTKVIQGAIISDTCILSYFTFWAICPWHESNLLYALFCILCKMGLTRFSKNERVMRHFTFCSFLPISLTGKGNTSPDVTPGHDDHHKIIYTTCYVSWKTCFTYKWLQFDAVA